MPTSRKRKSAPKPSAPTAAAPAKLRAGLWLLVAGVVALLGGWIWLTVAADRDFMALAAEGEPALARVATEPSRGRDHLAPGQSYRYPSRFPLSGPHAPTWTPPGFYDAPQPAVQLVHALEHGNIVIYYDAPGPEALETLKDWAGLYSGQWDGVVAVPAVGLGEAIELNAWTRRLRLETFDAAATAAFIDAFRGRGPENPVR